MKGMEKQGLSIVGLSSVGGRVCFVKSNMKGMEKQGNRMSGNIK